LFSQISISEIFETLNNSDVEEEANIEDEGDEESSEDGTDESPEDNSAIDDASQALVVSFQTVETEIEQLQGNLDKISFTSVIISNASAVNNLTIEAPSLDDNLIYDLTKNHKVFNDLNIRIGGNNLPRFSCACHKLNIVIQSSIETQGKLKDIIKGSVIFHYFLFYL